MKSINGSFRSCLLVIVILLFCGGIVIASPAYRIITSWESKWLNFESSPAIGLDSTLIVKLDTPITFTASFGTTIWTSDTFEIVPSLGGAWDFGKGWYTDFNYRIYIPFSDADSQLSHAISAAINFETAHWYFAFRETVRFNNNEISSLNTLGAAWSVDSGSKIGANIALAVSSDAPLAPAGWVSGLWRIVPVFGLNTVLAGGIEDQVLFFKISAGPHFFFKKSSVGISWESLFTTEAIGGKLLVLYNVSF